jgi:hypothetical protein
MPPDRRISQSWNHGVDVKRGGQHIRPDHAMARRCPSWPSRSRGLGIGPTATAHHRDVAPPAGDLHFEIAPGVMADILSRLEEPASLYRVRFAPGPPKLSTPSPRSVSSRAEPAA